MKRTVQKNPRTTNGHRRLLGRELEKTKGGGAGSDDGGTETIKSGSGGAGSTDGGTETIK